MQEYELQQLKTDHEVLKTDINAQLREINSKLDVILSGKGGNCIEHKNRVDKLEESLTAIQSNIAWIWKSILGSLLSAVGLYFFNEIIKR